MRSFANVGSFRFKFVGVAFNTTPYFRIYPVNINGTFGTVIASPGTLPTATSNSIRWSRGNNDYVAMGSTASPYVFVYPWTSYRSTGGYGTKFSDPATLPTGSVEHTDWNPTNTTIICGHFTSPYFSAYAWSSSGFGTKYADPAATGITVGLDVQFSPDGTVVIIGGTAAAGYAYPWSDSSGFGTKYADPVSMPGAVHGFDWNRAGTLIALGQSLSPYVQVFPWDNSSGWGTVYSQPATIPTSTCFMMKWSDNDEDIIGATDNSPRANGWKWTGTAWGTKYSNPATLPSGTGSGCDFDPANKNVTFSATLSPFILIYPWTLGTGFGTKRANPGTLPGGSALDAEYAF